MVLEHRVAIDFREQKWNEIDVTVIYRAEFIRHMQRGITNKDAKQRALTEVKGYLTSSGYSSVVHMLYAPSEQSKRTDQKNGNGVKAKGQSVLERISQNRRYVD